MHARAAASNRLCCTHQTCARSSVPPPRLQVSRMLLRGSSRSLLLLDEFGKGTLMSDGVGLLAALLQHFAGLAQPPFVLACTHFAELLRPGLLPGPGALALATMQVLVEALPADEAAAAAAGGGGPGANAQQQQGQQSAQQQQHVFLYRLVKGCVAASYGVSCRPKAACWRCWQLVLPLQQRAAGWLAAAAAVLLPLPLLIAAPSLCCPSQLLPHAAPCSPCQCTTTTARSQLQCARLCGVEEPVLLRAADVLRLQQAALPVVRLQLPQLAARDDDVWRLLRGLAALDTRDEAAVAALLQAAAAAEAAPA